MGDRDRQRRYGDDDFSRRDRDTREIRRDPRDPRDPRDLRDPRDNRDARETRPIDPRGAGRRTDDPMDTRLDNRMDTRMDNRMDTRMDNRMDNRIDPRADPRLDPRNDPTRDPIRMDPRVDNRLDNRLDSADRLLYQDPRGPDYREAPQRTPYGREDPRDRDEMMGRGRVIDYEPRDRTTPNLAQYNEYFLPGDGINREVIQYEICRYLGQDATVRPGTMPDGRRGYMIRAYRALTTAMISSLKEDSSRWEVEQDKKGRQKVPSYASSNTLDARERQERALGYRGVQPMDIDEDDYRDQMARGYGRDLDPRGGANMPGRHGVAAVTSTGYPSEASYPAYTLAPTQTPPGYYDPSREPRSAFPPSNTTPPPGTSRGAPPIYSTSAYPANTPATRQPAPPGVYVDARTGQPVTNYPSSAYAQEPPPSRHARR